MPGIPTAWHLWSRLVRSRTEYKVSSIFLRLTFSFLSPTFIVSILFFSDVDVFYYISSPPTSFIMKLPSSTSILFATLAISSSSSSLAAPTAPGDTSLTSSSSNHHLAFHRGPNVGHGSRGIRSPGMNLRRRPDRIVERRLAYRKLSLVLALIVLATDID